MLTRLPGESRLQPGDADALIAASFDRIVGLSMAPPEAIRLLGEAGVAAGATYDALVALASIEHNLPLLTRDQRALPTYAAIGVQVALIGFSR